MRQRSSICSWTWRRKAGEIVGGLNYAVALFDEATISDRSDI